MMKSILQMPWISKNVEILESPDPSLKGISGIILDETSRTLVIKSQNRRITVAKDVVKIKIENHDIDGKNVTQKPENRINRRYRMD